MSATATGAAVCGHCKDPLPGRAPGKGGRPAKFCGDRCRKADFQLATAARQARARLPRLRRYLDEALTEAQAALGRLHASGLDPEELLLRPGAKAELPGDVDYAVRSGLDRLRSTAREHRDAVQTAKKHPAGAGSEDDDE